MKQVLFPEVVWFQEGPGVRNTQYTNSGVKLLNVANLVDGKVDLSNTDRYISEEEAYGKYKHFLVDDGDFIIASSGIKVEYFDKKMGFISETQLPLCMNTSTIRFKVLDKSILDIRYFMYFLKTDRFKQQLAREITGSAQLNFGPSHLKKMHLPLIDLTAQRHIAAVLDKVSDLMAKRRQQLDKLDELVKSRFVEMFGDPTYNPKGYKIKKLSQLGELNRGVSKARPRNSPELLGGPYPLVQTGEVTASELYINTYENTYSEKGLAQSRMWPKGTLCITIAANIAQTAILNIDACFPDSVVGFIPGKEVTQIYMHYWFTFFQKILEEQAPQVAQKNINLKILNDLDVMVPERTLQEQFEKLVNQTDKSKSFDDLEVAA
ncbi:hypothetical protein B5F86_11915 [Lachnoclostridium sp. An298]|nr:hypothetical protein B5F86_11915 [Lachnoclostridium sp. An298]